MHIMNNYAYLRLVKFFLNYFRGYSSFDAPSCVTYIE